MIAGRPAAMLCRMGWIALLLALLAATPAAAQVATMPPIPKAAQSRWRTWKMSSGRTLAMSVAMTSNRPP